MTHIAAVCQDHQPRKQTHFLRGNLQMRGHNNNNNTNHMSSRSNCIFSLTITMFTLWTEIALGHHQARVRSKLTCNRTRYKAVAILIIIRIMVMVRGIFNKTKVVHTNKILFIYKPSKKLKIPKLIHNYIPQSKTKAIISSTACMT